jgi:hypothetical protein
VQTDRGFAQLPIQPDQEASMDPETLAYYQGIADYEAVLAGGGEDYSELAYYQGMADYEAALMGGEYGGEEEQYSPEELAYYQGMADYEAALMGGY